MIQNSHGVALRAALSAAPEPRLRRVSAVRLQSLTQGGGGYSREALPGSKRLGCRSLARGDRIAMSSHCIPSPITLTRHSGQPRIVQLDEESYRISHEQSPGSAAFVIQR